MTQQKEKKGCLYFIKLSGLVILALIVFGAVFREKDGQGGGASGTSSGTAQVAAAAYQTTMPESQKRFIAIVKEAQIASRSASNDMARGGVLANRNNALKNMMLDVSDWTGKVTKVDSNSDGLGVLEIEVADGITVCTWNNALSDIGEKTLLEPGSALFNAAASLSRGQYIKFSGRFFRDDESGFGEQSLSLRGKLDKPDFTFKFSSVTKL
jgi:hypothetical protein